MKFHATSTVWHAVTVALDDVRVFGVELTGDVMEIASTLGGGEGGATSGMSAGPQRPSGT
ncbi:hypothetical protein [Arthrobacter cryoconiti]|uniref:Uncharacterized protein n=1 Tax=Arthrobacter cryoconiti TaxID=748907 RepID=A0ABV8R0W9_9MICC|nr:hypothetical protein [Arthrobacter cryoconiti]MCC9067564.1 hypothetical protein [Arthrobacter cryoconiti]